MWKACAATAIVVAALMAAWNATADQLESPYGLVERNLGGVVVADMDFSTNGVQVIFDGGTAANPGLSLGDDDDGSGTGFFSVSANDLRVAVNGQVPLQFQQSRTQFNFEIYALKGITPAAVTEDPCGAGYYREGSIFYNTTGNFWCGCDGTNDIKLSDGTACF